MDFLVYLNVSCVMSWIVGFWTALLTKIAFITVKYLRDYGVICILVIDFTFGNIVRSSRGLAWFSFIKVLKSDLVLFHSIRNHVSMSLCVSEE